jgi:hypothetical protein
MIMGALAARHCVMLLKERVGCNAQYARIPSKKELLTLAVKKMRPSVMVSQDLLAPTA